MEYWSSSFIDGASSSNFIFPFYNSDHFSGTMVAAQQSMHHIPLAMVESRYGEESSNIKGHEKKNKKMTSEQLKFLERSFQEEIQLDPERKIKLSKELKLHPRQIAVWFQNRKVRWKNKQLEHRYQSLRQEFDVVSREKELLQEELLQLKSILLENGSRKKKHTWEAKSAQLQN